MTDSAWDCHVHVFAASAPGRAGHYAPRAAPLSAIEAVASASGFDRLVLVQPSVYGTDNAVLAQALEAGSGRHRGVAVVDAQVTDARLAQLDDAGVRGVRFNLVSPVGNDDQALLALAPRLRKLGWHVQWYARKHDLQRLAGLQRRVGLTFVLDHLGGITADTTDTDPAWDAMEQLARAGAWIKLGGWYRLAAEEPPYDAMVPHVRRAAALFGERMVWGSDWPHTSLPAGTGCEFADLLAPVRAALDESTVRRVLADAPRRLYA